MNRPEQMQLYDEQGQLIPGGGASRKQVMVEALLHGAAHVWVWRRGENGVEVLLQQRASGAGTWPNCYDISAAGHIDLGEEPLAAAQRETNEEIGLDVAATDLRFVDTFRSRLTVDNTDGWVENEFQWVYLLELHGERSFELQESEVTTLEWIALDDFQSEVIAESSRYVPHGRLYFEMVISAIQQASA